MEQVSILFLQVLREQLGFFCCCCYSNNYYESLQNKFVAKQNMNTKLVSYVNSSKDGRKSTFLFYLQLENVQRPFLMLAFTGKNAGRGTLVASLPTKKRALFMSF